MYASTTRCLLCLCYNSISAIALILAGGGLIACALVPVCAAAVAALAGAGVGLGIAALIVAVVALYEHDYCDPLLL